MDAASDTEIIRVFLVSRVIQITEAGTTSFVSPGNNALRRSLVHERLNSFHKKVMSSVCDGRVILWELRFRTNFTELNNTKSFYLLGQIIHIVWKKIRSLNDSRIRP